MRNQTAYNVLRIIFGSIMALGFFIMITVNEEHELWFMVLMIGFSAFVGGFFGCVVVENWIKTKAIAFSIIVLITYWASKHLTGRKKFAKQLDRYYKHRGYGHMFRKTIRLYENYAECGVLENGPEHTAETRRIVQ